jgi:hypothetical protein
VLPNGIKSGNLCQVYVRKKNAQDRARQQCDGAIKDGQQAGWKWRRRSEGRRWPLVGLLRVEARAASVRAAPAPPAPVAGVVGSTAPVNIQRAASWILSSSPPAPPRLSRQGSPPAPPRDDQLQESTCVSFVSDDLACKLYLF